jgi:4-aminobutyrate---pyruvate transaminase
VRPAGDTIAICPPLIIDDAEIEQLFDRRALTLDHTQAALQRRGVA